MKATQVKATLTSVGHSVMLATLARVQLGQKYGPLEQRTASPAELRALVTRFHR